MTIPYTFAGATTAIPLAQLDANFASPITLGNVAMTLSNTYTSIGNLTLTNVTISSGTINSAITQTYGNANAVVFTNSSNVATTSTSLYFDGTNLGIGTTSPVAKLQVRGSGTSGQVTSSFILENFSSGTFGADITGSAGSSYLRFLYGGGPSTGTNTLTETMRIGLEGTSAGVQQIKFAATQSASGDANCLDDYEEGTWTPNQGAGLTVVGTFASSGSYTKVGRMVYVRGQVSGGTSIAVSTAGVISTNLPFTAINDNAGSSFNAYLNSGGSIDAITLTVYSSASIIVSPVIFFSVTYQTS